MFDGSDRTGRRGTKYRHDAIGNFSIVDRGSNLIGDIDDIGITTGRKFKLYGFYGHKTSFIKKSIKNSLTFFFIQVG